MRKFGVFLLFDLTIAALCILGAWRVMLTAGFPVDVEKHGSALVVVSAPPLRNFGLNVGDLIQTVDEKHLPSPDALEFLCESKAIGDLVHVHIRRGVQEFTIPVALPAHCDLRYQLITSLAAFAFFAMALFVVFQRREDQAARALHHLGMSTAVLIQLTSGRFTIPPMGLGHAIEILFQFAYLAMPIAFVRFALLFPVARPRLLARVMPALYAVASLLGLWAGCAFMRATWPALDMKHFDGYVNAFDSIRIFFLFGILGAVAAILSAYRNAHDEIERRKLRWIFFGVGIGVSGFVLLWLLPKLILGKGILGEEWTLLLSIVAPITFTIALIRYRLFDINVLIKRSTGYALVVGTVFVAYLGIVALVSDLRGPTILPDPWPNVLGALLIAVLFEPLRRRVQLFVDRKFFRVEYDLIEAQRSFFEGIKFVNSRNSLATLVTDRIHALLPVTKIGFFVVEVPSDRLLLLAHRNFDVLERRKVQLWKKDLKTRLELPVALDGSIELGIEYEPADREVFARWGIALVLPMLSSQHEVLGFLVLSEKLSDKRFSSEDISLLTSVSTQSGIALERVNVESALLLEQAESERLAELSRLKSYFVSSVSHDLKTPLTSIRLFAELLADHEDLPRQKALEYLGIIEGESDRLSRLITNVLDFAKIEKGTKEYSFKQCDLNNIVRDVLRSLDYQITSHGFQVHTNIYTELLRIEADADAVFDAMTNLISNAMKYSPPDRKCITIETASKDGFAILSIQDEGYGIPQEEIDHIFESFYRIDDVKLKSAGGAGIGLSIVKHTMNAHRGKVEVQSEVGKGSTFALLFPLLPQ